LVYNIDDLINVREAANQCGRNAETVRRWIWGGKLPAQKIGNQLFINKQDLALFCREIAIAYRAEPGITRTTGNRTTLLKHVNGLRGQTRTGTGVDFDVEKDVSEMREEHMNKINLMEKGDFLERAIQFRKKLKARGYTGVDAADLVRRSREGRTHELGQSLR
jgi:excisionase family DNA binding protein